MGLSSKIQDVDTRRAVQNLELRMNKVASPLFSGIVFEEVNALPDPAIADKIVVLETDHRLYFGKET